MREGLMMRCVLFAKRPQPRAKLLPCVVFCVAFRGHCQLLGIIIGTIDIDIGVTIIGGVVSSAYSGHRMGNATLTQVVEKGAWPAPRV